MLGMSGALEAWPPLYSTVLSDPRSTPKSLRRAILRLRHASRAIQSCYGPEMTFLLAALMLAQPAAAPDPEPPPTEMIDFLGRRRLCLELPAPAERNAFDQSESRRLACTSLPAEERVWRDHYRGNAGVLAWLDRDPRDFRLPQITVSFDGPPPAYVHRIELSGTDSGGQTPFHLSIDSDAENGGATLFTAAWGDVPARTFRIDNARFPWLDLQSVITALRTQSADGFLRVELRFGYHRGYCAALEEDDRPRLMIRFARDRVAASFEDRTNCEMRNVDLPD
jgi:hypothetical protein